MADVLKENMLVIRKKWGMEQGTFGQNLMVSAEAINAWETGQVPIPSIIADRLVILTGIYSVAYSPINPRELMSLPLLVAPSEDPLVIMKARLDAIEAHLKYISSKMPF